MRFGREVVWWLVVRGSALLRSGYSFRRPLAGPASRLASYPGFALKIGDDLHPCPLRPPAGSGLLKATIRSAAEQLGAALLGSILTGILGDTYPGYMSPLHPCAGRIP